MQVQGRAMGSPFPAQVMSPPQANYYPSSQINSGPPTFMPNQYPRPEMVQRNIQLPPQNQYYQPMGLSTNAAQYGQPLIGNPQGGFLPFNMFSGGSIGFPDQYRNMQPSSHFNRYDEDNRMSSSNINMNIQEQRVFCILCQETYSYSQRQEHIERHKMMRNNRQENRIKNLIGNYDAEDGPIARPIVEPEEFNIQYNPNKYILQHETNYATADIRRPGTSEHGIGTDPIPKRYNRNQNPAPVMPMDVIHEETHQQNINPVPQQPQYNPEIIQIGDEASQDLGSLFMNDQRNNYQQQRRAKQNIYQENIENSNNNILPPSIYNSNERFSRDSFVSDQQSQPRGIDALNNRQTMQSQYRGSNVSNSNQNTSYLNTQPVIQETEEQNRNSFDPPQNQNQFHQSNTYNSGYRQTSQHENDGQNIQISNRQPSNINDSSFRQSSYVDNSNYRQPSHVQNQNYPQHSQVSNSNYRQSSQVDNSNYRQPSHVENSNYNQSFRQPSQISNSNYMQPSYADNSNYRQASQVDNQNFRQPSQVSNSNYRQSSQVNNSNYRQPSHVDDSTYLQPNQTNNYNQRQQSQVSNSNYRQPSQVDNSNYRQSSQVDKSYYRQSEQMHTSNQPYGNQTSPNFLIDPSKNESRMTYQEKQIPFEEIVGQKRGVSYQPKREDSLDIIEGNKSVRPK